MILKLFKWLIAIFLPAYHIKRKPKRKKAESTQTFSVEENTTINLAGG